MRNQADNEVLEYIKEHGSITTSGLKELGITNRSTVIRNLRRKYAIKTEQINRKEYRYSLNSGEGTPQTEADLWIQKWKSFKDKMLEEIEHLKDLELEKSSAYKEVKHLIKLMERIEQ